MHDKTTDVATQSSKYPLFQLFGEHEVWVENTDGIQNLAKSSNKLPPYNELVPKYEKVKRKCDISLSM